MGIQKALLCSSVMAILGSAFKIAFDVSFKHILLGRLINGLGTGILYFLYGKSLNETIPNHLLPTYSIFTFTLILSGFLGTGWISYILPEHDAPLEERLKDKSWKIVYGWTIILQLIGIPFILIFLKNPSLNFLIKKCEKQLALVEIKKIYRPSENLTEKEKTDFWKQIYTDI